MKTMQSLAAIAALLTSSLALAAPVNINTATAAEIAEALTGVDVDRCGQCD